MQLRAEIIGILLTDVGRNAFDELLLGCFREVQESERNYVGPGTNGIERPSQIGVSVP